VTCDDDGHRRLLLFLRNNSDEQQIISEDGLVLPDTGVLRLAARLDGKDLQFAWAVGAEDLQEVGPVVDASILSDENACGGWGFTGAFVGICALDLGGSHRPADFDYFKAS